MVVVLNTRSSGKGSRVQLQLHLVACAWGPYYPGGSQESGTCTDISLIIIQYITTQQLEPGGQPIPRILHKSVQLTGGVVSYSLCAPLTFNMEPDNKPLEREIPLGKRHFQVPCLSSGGVCLLGKSQKMFTMIW